MAHRHSPAAALFALLAFGSPASAQSPEPALPRVIYGQTEPQVLYGPSSPPPEAPLPRIVAPQTAPAPPPEPSGTSMSYGWVPAGPPVWYGPPVNHRPGWNRPPPPPAWGVRPTPHIDNRFERPLPPGRYLGTPPGASMPIEPRQGFERR